MFSPSWYTQHPQEVEQDSTIEFEAMSLDKFNQVVNKAALSNQDRQAEAIRKADSYAFQIAHPEWLRTASNERLMNHWLDTRGITQPTFPDFEAGYQALFDVADIDQAEIAKQQDANSPRTYKGTFTKRTFTSLDEMIGAERQAALQQVTPSTDEDVALESLPLEQVQTLLRDAERATQKVVNTKHTQRNADVWLQLHPEFSDSKHNGQMMRMQLATNGVLEDVATVEDYEKAFRQLNASGLLQLKKAEVLKQHVEELRQEAEKATQQFGTVFDATSEEEMYNLPLDEIRRRATGNFSGF